MILAFLGTVPGDSERLIFLYTFSLSLTVVASIHLVFPFAFSLYTALHSLTYRWRFTPLRYVPTCSRCYHLGARSRLTMILTLPVGCASLRLRSNTLCFTVSSLCASLRFHLAPVRDCPPLHYIPVTVNCGLVPFTSLPFPQIYKLVQWSRYNFRSLRSLDSFPQSILSYIRFSFFFWGGGYSFKLYYFICF